MPCGPRATRIRTTGRRSRPASDAASELPPVAADYSGTMSSPFSRLGLRAQLLVAPAAVLILAAIISLTSYRQLDGAATNAKLAAANTTAVEILRDSNSRQFEGDRFQNLALASTSKKEFDANRDEAANVMKESADGFDEFSKGATSPALRKAATDQAALMRKIQSERERAFDVAAASIGKPLPAEAAKI